jgi:hypothetical protein
MVLFLVKPLPPISFYLVKDSFSEGNIYASKIHTYFRKLIFPFWPAGTSNVREYQFLVPKTNMAPLYCWFSLLSEDSRQLLDSTQTVHSAKGHGEILVFLNPSRFPAIFKQFLWISHFGGRISFPFH